MRYVYMFLAGALFGGGLFVSGMTDTTKVQGWLDIFGDWDPTLAFVMGGAIVPMAIAWQIKARRARAAQLAWDGSAFPEDPKPMLGRELVIGSTMFGAGWGLAGLCPGPAIASLTYGGWPHWVFFAAMLAGMYIAKPLREIAF